MSENKRFTYLNYSKKGYIGSFYLNDKPITTKEVWELLKKQKEEITSLKSSNMELEDANARLEERVKTLEEGILDCLFDDISLGQFALKMELVE